MQILSLPKNLYKFYAYARTQEALDVYRHVYQNQVTLWRELKAEGVSDMTVKKNGTTFKHFQAWDRRSKFIYANVFAQATARSAAQFIKELKEVCPFKIQSIQVDRGSEFMAEFDKTCQELAIPLMVLPPSKPQYNGGVERANRTFREEFYARPNLLADTISTMRKELARAISVYNFFRPHFALKGLTPMQYINNIHNETSKKSHPM